MKTRMVQHGRSQARWLLWPIVALLLLDRCLLLGITAPFASDDLTVIWLGSVDYSHGFFREPYFYGQDYGVMLEALLAAPFVRAGADVTLVVPWIMGLLALIPYLSYSIFLQANRKYYAAWLFAAMPLLLAPENGLQVTGLNGLALLALYPWTTRIGQPFFGSAFGFLVLAAAVLITPNALLLSLPFGIYWLLNSPNKRAVLPGALLGIIPVVAAWQLASTFYSSCPNLYTIFDWRMEFHPNLIPEALISLDKFLAWLCPIFWHIGSLALLAHVVLVVLLILKRNWPMVAAGLAALLLILFSFAFAKVHNGTDSIFFPLSRMFLGMPLLLAWLAAPLFTERSQRKVVGAAFICICFLCAVLRAVQAGPAFGHALAEQEQAPLRVRPITLIRMQCAGVAAAAERTGASLIIADRDPDAFTAQFLTYALPALQPSAPPIHMPSDDRTDRCGSVFDDSVPTTVLVVGGGIRVLPCLPMDTVRTPTSGVYMHLLADNHFSVFELKQCLIGHRP